MTRPPAPAGSIMSPATRRTRSRRSSASRARARSASCRSPSPKGLIKVRLDHPIANCLELAAKLQSRFALDTVEVVPSDPGNPSTTLGVAEAAAAEIEKWLRTPSPIVMAIGTGRTLKAAIEQLSPMDCPQHKVVSLTGNISPDGSAAYYNVIFTMADLIKARSFPMPLAGHRLVARGARDAAPPGDDPADAGAGRTGRRHLRRHRRSRARRRRSSSTASSTRPSSRRCRRRAPSARSAAGPSTATAG